MAYHVMRTDLAGVTHLVGCFISIEAAACCKTTKQSAHPEDLYWVQPTTCCTCNQR